MSDMQYKKRRLYRFCDGSVDKPLLKQDLEEMGYDYTLLRAKAWEAYDNVCCDKFSKLIATADIDVHTGKVLRWSMSFTSNMHPVGAADDEGFTTFTETLKCCPFCGRKLVPYKRFWRY